MTGECCLWRYVLRSLRPPLIFLAALAALWAVVLWAPVYPVRATCFDDEDGIVYIPITGAFTYEYTEAMRAGMRRVPHFVDGHRMWVSAWEALAGHGIGRANEEALWAVVERRTGIGKRQFRTGEAHIAGFESDTTPTCAAVQAIATVGGAWARDGPSPIWRRAFPGDAAPDYSQEGDLPPVERGVRRPARVDTSWSHPRPGPRHLCRRLGAGLEGADAGTVLSLLVRLSRLRADPGGDDRLRDHGVTPQASR